MKRLLIPLFALALLAACNGNSLEKRAEKAIKAIEGKKMETLATFVHPVKGVRFTPYTFVNGGRNIFFYAKDLPGAMGDDTIHRWGERDGSGEPIFLTFAQYFEEFVYDHDYSNAEEVTWNERMGHGNMIDNAAEAYPGSQIVEYYFSGFDEQYDGMDWASLRLVWEEFDGTWYLVGIIHDQWTI